ncbi:MAG: tetrahydrofolate dehydrogenase/cyclohydrolase catalytic domain-containing protein, partial [Bradyrhizobium sp.]
MTARLIDGKAIAAGLRRKIAGQVARVKAAHGLTPGIAVVMAGDDPASNVYVRAKSKAVAEAGMLAFDHRLPADAPEAALLDVIAKLNVDDRVNGILVQQPLPKHMDPHDIVEALNPAKDVDGFHPFNAGRLARGLSALVPCTPLGCVRLAKSVHPSL